MLCAKSVFLLLILVENSCPYQIVFPQKVSRFTRSNDNLMKINIDTGQSDKFSLQLRKNNHLLTQGAIIEWHHPNGTKEFLNLHQNSEQIPDCLYVGEIIGKNKSLAALDVCDGYKGYIRIGSDGYILQPLEKAQDGAPHSLEKLSGLLENLKVDQDEDGKRAKRSTSEWNGYYLGDIWKTRSGYTSKVINNYDIAPPSEVIYSSHFSSHF